MVCSTCSFFFPWPCLLSSFSIIQFIDHMFLSAQTLVPQSRVPGCYLPGLYIFCTLRMVAYEQQTTTDSSSEGPQKKGFSLLSVCVYSSITSLFLQLVHNGLCHAAFSEFFWLGLTQTNLFLEGFYRCPFAPSPYHSLDYSLPLPSCTFHRSTALKNFLLTSSYWAHSSEIAFMTTV